jgi:hypothetical protein
MLSSVSRVWQETEIQAQGCIEKQHNPEHRESSLPDDPTPATNNKHPQKKEVVVVLGSTQTGQSTKKGTRTSPQPNSLHRPSPQISEFQEEEKNESHPSSHTSAGADSQIPTPSLHPLDSTTETLTQPNPAQAAKTGKPRSKPTAACQRALTPSYLTKTSERSAH